MILIVGATGTLGGRIAHDLLATGKTVRILVREPSPSSEMAAMGQALPVNYVPPRAEVPLLPPLAGAMLSAWETNEVFIDMGDLPAQCEVELTPLPVTTQRMFGR